MTVIRRTGLVVLLWLLLSPSPAALKQSDSDKWRRYSRCGLELDLRHDWKVSQNSPLEFESHTAGITFIVWLPLNQRSYFNLYTFDQFVAEKLSRVRQVKDVRDVRRRQVSGFAAVTFSAFDHEQFPGFPRLAFRETWIAVPETKNAGTVYRFFLQANAYASTLEADFILYEKMIDSLRLDPLVLQQVPEGCPR